MGSARPLAVAAERIAGGGWVMKRSKPRRLLYRTGYTPAELDQLVAEIGHQPLLAALDRWAVRYSDWDQSTPAE